ncbi:YrhB family protein, partial [Bacillus thuringiensis]|nr:YrhB family protein [Bacillus thuringiensis]
MITYHDAFAKANHYLDDADLPVVITLHGRYSQGWYFCFEAREFLETGDEA